MKAAGTAEQLAALQELIDRSVASAGAAAADSVANPERQMSAAELVDFWRETSLIAMTTVGPDARPHAAPVHARLEGDELALVIYDNTRRRADLRDNPHVAFTTWGSMREAVILYGRASEVPGSLREASTSATGQARKVVEIRVKLSRVYAMRIPG